MNMSLVSNKSIKEKASNLLKEINHIKTFSSDNARSVEEISSAAEHLSKLTEDLNILLNQFKTN